MKYLKYVLMCGLLGLPVLSACNTPDFGVIAVEPLTPDQATIETTVGERVELVLPTPGVGSAYEWTFAPLPEDAPLTFIEEKSAASRFPNRTPANYAPDRIFVFEALRSGELEILFSQTVREGLDAPEIDENRRFTLRVR